MNISYRTDLMSGFSIDKFGLWLKVSPVNFTEGMAD